MAEKISAETVEIQARVVAALDVAGMMFEAQNIRECGKFWNQWRCDNCGERSWTAVGPCNKRLCPWCAKRRSAKAYAIYHEKLAEVKSPKMMVLTVRNVPLGELAISLKKLGQCLTEFWSKNLKKKITGAVVAIEVTYNSKTRTWHPHAHVLLDGPYLEQAWIANRWNLITMGWGQVVWIEQCREGWEKELLKYVTKQVAFLDEPKALCEFVFAAKRFRFLRTWGSFYGLNFEDVDEEWERQCPKCHTVMVLDERSVLLERLIADGNGIYKPGAASYHDPPAESWNGDTRYIA